MVGGRRGVEEEARGIIKSDITLMKKVLAFSSQLSIFFCYLSYTHKSIYLLGGGGTGSLDFISLLYFIIFHLSLLCIASD